MRCCIFCICTQTPKHNAAGSICHMQPVTCCLTTWFFTTTKTTYHKTNMRSLDVLHSFVDEFKHQYPMGGMWMPDAAHCFLSWQTSKFWISYKKYEMLHFLEGSACFIHPVGWWLISCFLLQQTELKKKSNLIQKYKKLHSVHSFLGKHQQPMWWLLDAMWLLGSWLDFWFCVAQQWTWNNKNLIIKYDMFAFLHSLSSLPTPMQLWITKMLYRAHWLLF